MEAIEKAPTRGWKVPRIHSLRSLALQVVIVAAVFSVFVFLVDTTLTNLHDRGVATGFGFLWRPLNMPIGQSWIAFAPGIDNYGKAILIGILNTLWVSFIVIVISTILGALIGISRLSPNWLLSRSCGAYVEVIRNVPVLLQLVFWYQLILQVPPPRRALEPFAGIFISNRGIRYPALELDWASRLALATLVAGLLIVVLLAIRNRGAWRGRRAWLAGIALSIAASIAVFAGFGAAPHWTSPELQGFDFAGGATLSPEFAALILGLAIYASAYVAEIVRAGITGVGSGQWEAANSLGLRRPVTLRKIILPQALRIIVPPLASEYLGIVKNSSLAVAVGYPDLVAIINTMISDTGQAVEGIAIVMVAYLAISMAMSALMNWYNARVALVAR